MLSYTYVLVDPRDDSVFYVGKGTGGRVLIHFRVAKRGKHYNPRLQNKLSKIESLGFKATYERIFEHEDDWPCLFLEMLANRILRSRKSLQPY